MRSAKHDQPTTAAVAGERGQIIVMAALLAVVIAGIGALALDLGFLMRERQSVQNAVDAAALAGASLLPDDGVGAEALALQYAKKNNPALDASKASVSFRCLVGDRNNDGVADPGDIPGVCDPKTNASWKVKNGLAVSPCVPSTGGKCNVLVVTAQNTQTFYLAPALGIKEGSTGSVNAAACRGACGGPPSGPVDVVLVNDRTGSMSSADIANVKAADRAVLALYDPKLQHVALGLLGPSNTGTNCSGSNSPAKVAGASSSQYATANWVPVGLSGVGAPVNEAYLNANGTLNTSSLIVKAINCFNTSSTGTNLSTPMKKAKEYVLANGRAGVKKGIIFMTDGTPNFSGAGTASDYTCLAAFNEAQAAKTAGIEIFTIGFGVSSGDTCPDSTGAYKSKSVTKALADMATTSIDNGCNTAENTDQDHFFCAPRTEDLTTIFQSAASALAGGSRLVSLPE